MSGYGVELALKRTDYIVIDDRGAEKREENEEGDNKKSEEKEEKEEEEGKEDAAPGDLKPLSSSEVSRLGMNTATYVMDSDDPFATLLNVLQDFPRYASRIAAHRSTPDLVNEMASNLRYASGLPRNSLFINGAQVNSRETDAFSLVDQLRRERRLVEKFGASGFSADQMVNILAHDSVVSAQSRDEAVRYDYRDNLEGGGVIIWANDLEKDARYKGWPEELFSFLTMFPGQMPMVRRDLQNIVFPADLSRPEDVELIRDTVSLFLARLIPIRFGIVPIVSSSPASREQVKVAHYLVETFGLSTLLRYLEESLASRGGGEKMDAPNKSIFLAVTEDPDKQALSFEEVLESEELDAVVSRTLAYQNRLNIEGEEPPVFANGVAVPRSEAWTRDASIQISRDLQVIQLKIAKNEIDNDAWLPGILLSNAFERRNPLVIPEDANAVRIVDLVSVLGSRPPIWKSKFPLLNSTSERAFDTIHLIVAADFDSNAGASLLSAALSFKEQHEDAEIIFIHNPGDRMVAGGEASTSVKLYRSFAANPRQDAKSVQQTVLDPSSSEPPVSRAEAPQLSSHKSLAQDLGFSPGTSGIVISGRAIGPVPNNITFSASDFDQLAHYERITRLEPVAEAIRDLGLDAHLSSPLDFAMLSSLVALSMVSDVPEGIFDSHPPTRVNMFDKWSTNHSAITLTNTEHPAISVVAVMDPASELAQRTAPVLKVLSKLAGVNVRIFLNPREELTDIPIKRFYRYVLNSGPVFSRFGTRVDSKAVFAELPEEALLTLGMDVPSLWLVAPKKSVYDLDNVKLSSLKEGNVDAVYGLEHILIEGHSRDMTTGYPSRGVQLRLGTQENPDFSDTIVMANLGYFQFKAQPGMWEIGLVPGRSQEIFNLDSIGANGFSPKPDDKKNEVALFSFQGRTLFPRLSRKEGYETASVLDIEPVHKGSLSRGLKKFASGILSGGRVDDGGPHADINIFSVASGHLYERMLNIMMLSVMRHTKHSVKFWFIEQFLSPSFKSFLPHMARQYGFSYEMVSYKWPHWLRGQKEKQREIWGYKILFLDVLFPLSLDKVIFVDADQIVRTDMYDLVTVDLQGAPYGFAPMGDSRTEMEGFRFWKGGYWKNFLGDRPYHISALYVVDLKRFRALAAGDRLRGQYQALSADPNSLSNLDQDLPNNMIYQIPIKTLPQDWLWCETWCSDESLSRAKTIDLCNNPLTKEPKLDRARRQVPEWTAYDDEIAALADRVAAAEKHPATAWNKDEL